MTEAARTAGAPLAGTGAGRLRLFAILAGLYMAQSIPAYLMVAAIPPILREQGVSRTAIGLLSLLMLPLILKFAWAPIVDRVRPFALGHRRAWILPTQIGIVAAIVGVAFASPGDFWTLFVLGCVISVLLSTQDIATDGYATQRLRERDRGIGNAIQGGSVALGVVVGGTLTLVLYREIGWTASVLIVAGLSTLPLLAISAMTDDPAPPRRTAGAPGPSIRAFLRRPEARLALIVALTYRASEGLVKAMESPYLVDAGVPLDVIGYLSGASAATAGIVGSIIAALAVRRLGNRGSLVALGGLRTVCFLLFALHASGALGGIETVMGAAVFQTLIRYMEIVALYSLFMAVAASDQPGTDFTILACAQIVVYLIGASIAGAIADLVGYASLFAIATVLSFAGVLLTAWLLGDRRSDQRGTTLR